MDTWQALDEERSALADDLATLADGQWDAQSLCSKWKVRHVVGHLIFGANMTTGRVLAGLLKSGGSFNRFMARDGLVAGAAPPDDLLRQFRKTIGARRVVPGATPEVLLIDLVCHGGDIRWPTGLSGTAPQATLLAVADALKDIGFPIHAKRRITELRLSATDSDWSTGNGAPVEGPLASLILVMAGRKAPLDDLSGAGTRTLRDRL
jgi:uncharacterized protein (TIGR03083 family)